MEVTFKFNLPDEKDDFEMYRQAPDYYSCLCELDRQIRDWSKHREIKPDFEEMVKSFYDVLEEHKISIY